MSSASKLRDDLPRLPMYMRNLPVDRGYPVPHFVIWLDENGKELPRGEGKPDFRVVSPKTIVDCWNLKLCWSCGEPLGQYVTFLVGPMCAVNGISAEPPSHYDCATFSALACPFLSRPHAKRREAGLPSEVSSENVAGVMLPRNPGVTLIWQTSKPSAFLDGGGKPLFNIGPHNHHAWFREGRSATRSEIWESIESGLPALFELCETTEERAEVVEKAEYVKDTLLPDA